MHTDPEWEAKVRAEERVRVDVQETEKIKRFAGGCLLLLGLLLCIVFPPLLLAILSLSLIAVIVNIVQARHQKRARNAQLQLAEQYRQSRLAAIEGNPSAFAVYSAELDRLEPSWRETGRAQVAHVDQALDRAEAELARSRDGS